jgi:hypothetical protein
MSNQVSVSPVRELVLGLPRPLRAMERALNQWMAAKDGAAHHAHPDKQPEASTELDELPMPHLFLLDMKIGR